ncbi:hypothetical protein [Halomarina ordinaria]|uniref:Uncharacterized protein n=1 Tax=Halomarina ordinaria TaxID=3033939 RepID=A0ABD5UK60_9EURY|nr:hypothetical protein [Halomarina sp. PSRA2]
MERNTALTVYLILPCLLYGTAFATIVTQYPEMISTEQLRGVHAVFGAVIACILYTKKDELTGGCLTVVSAVHPKLDVYYLSSSIGD